MCHPERSVSPLAKREVEGRPSLSRPALVALMLVAIAACSGNFSSGTQGNPIPPVGSSGPFGATVGSTAKPSATSSATPGPAIYPLADAPNGFSCPDTLPDYSCQIRFNVPPPTPTPKPNPKAKHAPPPTPSPSPTPAPASSGSASPSPASSAPTVTLTAEAQPKAAPAMVHVPKDVSQVVPLMSVTLSTTADFPLDGLAIASFTVPKDQIPGRGFALQLFVQRMQGKSKSYAPVLSLDKSSLQKNTLVFGFMPPKIVVAKNTTYVLTLYATQIAAPSSASPSPAPSPSASASP